jgi:hypothetical protein
MTVTCPTVTTLTQITAPITSVFVTYLGQLPSGASPSGWEDMVDITITTGSGFGNQPDITLSVSGLGGITLSRPINGSTGWQWGIPAAGGSYQICADFTCTDYTSFPGHMADLNGNTPAGTAVIYTPNWTTGLVIVSYAGSGWYNIGWDISPTQIAFTESYSTLKIA